MPRHRTKLEWPARLRALARGRVFRYLVGIALTVALLGVRVALDPVLGRQNNRHIVMLPTIMLASWLGGFGAGAVATLIDAVALQTLFRCVHPCAISAVGDLVLFVVVALAVSALVSSLMTARRRADAAKVARDHILAIVAHDLNNPLNLIRLAAAAIQRGSPDPAATGRRLVTIDRAVDRMDRLIRDLVDATRIEREELSVTLLDEPLSAVLREVSDAFGPAAKERGIDLHVDLASGEDVSGEDVWVTADRARLTQVFGNLLGNALKFTPRGGSVALHVREGEAEVRFEVTDTGPGIEPEHLPHVFERYWTRSVGPAAAGAPRPAQPVGGNIGGGGTGLGLFIARSIVAAHGGDLAVASRPGDGATFFFAIPRGRPRAPGEPRAPGPDRAEAPLAAGGKDAESVPPRSARSHFR